MKTYIVRYQWKDMGKRIFSIDIKAPTSKDAIRQVKQRVVGSSYEKELKVLGARA